MATTIIFEPSYKEGELCYCGKIVKHFNKHILTKKHLLFDKENNMRSEIKKKEKKTKEDRKEYMREYMKKYNEEKKESYEERKEKYKEYRKENRIKCLKQMYKSRERVFNNQRKNYSRSKEEEEE